MISSEKFNKKIAEFEKDEGRGIIYWRSKEIISRNKEFEVEAILLVLTTWNFAHMSTSFKKAKGNKFNYDRIKEPIEEVEPYLDIIKKKQ